MGRLPLLVREPVEGLERRDSVELAGALDDRAGDGMERVGIALDQRLHRGIALGDPWAVVEGASDLGERLEVEFDDPGAQRSGKLEVLREGLCRLCVVEELTLIGARNAEPDPARQGGQRRCREQASVSVLLVESAGGLIDRERVGDIAGEDRDCVERPAGRDDAGRGESAKRRLQADDPVERRRHAARSRRVRAKRERNEARADGCRRAGARSSGYEIGAQRVAWDPIRRTDADEAGRELVEIRFADDDRAGALEPLDDERGLVRAIGEGGTGRRRRKPGDVDIVLDDKRNPIEGPALAP